MTTIAILGGGTAGTIMANRLARAYRRAVADQRMRITVVDQDNCHVYQPGLLFVPFGIYDQRSVTRPRARQLARGVEYVQAPIDRVDPDLDLVRLADGRSIGYDVLIVATGVTTAPEDTEGMTGPGWRERIFDFYTVEGATALRGALERFTGGRLVVNITDMPIKCPVAPLEFAFLADAYFTRRGIRDRVRITYVTPLDSAFTKPVCSRHLTYLLRDKGIELVTEFNTGTVDGTAGRLVAYDEREVPFDLLVTVPLHAGAAWVGRSAGLGDDLRFVKVDPRTLQAERKPNIFALGDASNVPTSKAGSVAHFQAEVLERNVRRFLEGRPLEPAFDGHANCFIETGHGKALLIDFNYEVQPLPGRFPVPRLGPMALLAESRVNHWGKMAFRWIYWNLLLPGRDLPLVGPQMTMRGKHGFADAEAGVGEPVAV